MSDTLVATVGHIRSIVAMYGVVKEATYVSDTHVGILGVVFPTLQDACAFATVAEDFGWTTWIDRDKNFTINFGYSVDVCVMIAREAYSVEQDSDPFGQTTNELYREFMIGTRNYRTRVYSTDVDYDTAIHEIYGNDVPANV